MTDEKKPLKTLVQLEEGAQSTFALRMQMKNTGGAVEEKKSQSTAPLRDAMRPKTAPVPVAPAEATPKIEKQ